MYTKILIFIMSILLVSCGDDAPNNAVAQISSSKKIFIDGNNIRTSAGGSRVLYIDGSDIRPEPGGKRLLYLDGSDVRPEPGGVRLAFWDGNTLRRTPGGNILLKIDGYQILNPNGQKIYSFEPGSYSQAQITAALYYLNANLFKPSAEELAAAQAAIAEGQAWDNQQAQAENENGEYSIINSGGGYKDAGKCQIQWLKDHYALTFENNLSGLAIKRDDSGYHLTGALGKGNYFVGLFKFDNNAYTGNWYNRPTAAANSTEKYNVSFDGMAATPFNSSAMGTLTFSDTGEKLEGEGKIFDVQSSNGQSGKAYQRGTQITGYYLVIALGAEVAIFDFKSDGGMFNGDYAGNKESGFFIYTK